MKRMIHTFLLICFSLMVSNRAIAQTKVVKELLKSNEAKTTSYKDTLNFSNGSEPFYYGYQFGRNLTICYPLKSISADTIEVYKLIVPFYGGRTDTASELYVAKIKAYIWEKVDTSLHFNSNQNKRVSSAVDISVSAEQIKWVTFTFTDSTAFKNDNLWLGINYELDNDSLNSASPIFSSAPETINAIYQRIIRIDSAHVDTIRYSHQNFWKNPTLIGGMNAFLEYKSVGAGKGITAIESIGESKPELYSIKTYPNPFNPSTTIGFKALANGRASVTIYSIIGEHIFEYNVDTIKGNEYSFKWNARQQASGIYLIILKQNSDLRVNTVTLLK